MLRSGAPPPMGGSTNGQPVRLEAGELRSFLMSVDEFQQIFGRMERRLRDSRVVEVLANVDYRIDSKDDFHVKDNVEPVQAALQAAKIDSTLVREEEHTAWMVGYRDPSNAERVIGVELAGTPKYRRKFIEENALDVRNLDV